MARDESSNPHAPRIVNRKARHDYHILDTLEVGLALQGSEVKSIRLGQVSLTEGYAAVEPNSLSLTLFDVNIAPYAQAHGANCHDPKRPRRLLAHKREIRRLLAQTTAKGATLIPLAMYFKGGLVKLEIGLATGKKRYDKRQDLKAREARREMDRGMTRKRL